MSGIDNSVALIIAMASGTKFVENSMRIIKPAIYFLVLSFFLNGLLIAQEQEPSIYLDTFEKCNNFARHYCLNGSHEAAVNRALLDMKRKGYSITPKVIQSVARSTPSRMRNPVSQSVE